MSDRAESIPKLGPENGFDLGAEGRTFLAGGSPNLVPVNSEVRMHEDVAERHDPRPGHLRVASLEAGRDMGGSFADQSEFLDYRTPYQFRLLETGAIQSRDELGDVVRGLDDIAEEQLLTPHKAAGNPG